MDIFDTSSRPSPRGFTLIEMMITIAVAVVLLAIVAPSFKQIIAGQRIKTASSDLFSALNYARSEAIKRNASVVLKAGATSSGAWNTGWRLVDPNDATKNLRSWGAISNLTIAELTGNATAVTFGKDGRVAAPLPVLKVSSTVSVSGVPARCVQIELSGTATTKACP